MEERIANIEAEIAAARSERQATFAMLQRMDQKLDVVHDQMMRWRGGFWVMCAMLGSGAAVVTAWIRGWLHL